MRKKMIVKPKTTTRKATATERRVWMKAEAEAEAERERYVKNKVLVDRYEHVKALWARRQAEVEAALAEVTDPREHADRLAVWRSQKAQIEACVAEAGEAVDRVLGRTVEAPSATDRAAEVRAKNLGMTPIKAKAVQAETAPQIDPRLAAVLAKANSGHASQADVARVRREIAAEKGGRS